MEEKPAASERHDRDQTRREPERDLALTLDELAGATGTSTRTIRYYIAEGLLPGPEGRGSRASYGPEHLLRLRLIRRLSDRRIPLAEIRALVGTLAVEEVEALLRAEEAERESAPRHASYHEARIARLLRPRPGLTASTEAYRLPREATIPNQQAQSWRRWELAPGLELHAREDTRARHRDLIARLLKDAGAPEDAPHHPPRD